MRVSILASIAVLALACGCSGNAFVSSHHSQGANQKPYSARGVPVSAAAFARMTSFKPAPGSVPTSDTTVQMVDNGRIYIFPSDALIQASPAGTTVIVGHIVKHLSANARIVGHGTHRHWFVKS